MHKFICNSVNKLKHLSFPDWITEINSKNVARSYGVHTVSGANAKNQNVEGTVKKVINFDEMVTTRRAQAQRSILVQVQSDKSFADLQMYCSQFGSISGAYHYKLGSNQFILIEFSKVAEAQQALKCSTFEDTTGIRVQSPFLWFRAARNGSVTKEHKSVSRKLTVTNGCRPIDYNQIKELMRGANSLSDQIDILFRSTMLDDLGIRMRFLAARQIEESVYSVFPSARACIFGSSVNGYGKLGCDLDLVLQFNPSDCDLDTKKRLAFHVKKSDSDARVEVKKNLTTISEIMRRFLPGISNVRPILPAAVPIVKFHHDILDLEVDLSLSNPSGVYMSELLYMCTQIDDRVQPLVHTIRRWAYMTGVTRSAPGQWISNFSLTCLVIFYLQQLKVLPTINSLIEQARPQDRRDPVEDGAMCTFLRDVNVLKFTKQNTDELNELLIGFFEYYSQMDLAEKAISLNDAQLQPKPNSSPMYVFNPLEPTLNVTKNLSIEERERFRTEARNASSLLASTETSASKRKTDGWGLMNLLGFPLKSASQPASIQRPRMCHVQKIFGETNDDAENDTKIRYKNDSVRKEVANIQKKNKSDVNVMKAGRSKS